MDRITSFSRLFPLFSQFRHGQRSELEVLPKRFASAAFALDLQGPKGG